jgi:hypothetical protein
MLERNVMTPSDALVYILDCTLATVEGMALKKSRPPNEYKRQISIAQKALDWCVTYRIPVTGTRGDEIVKANQTVEQWAKEIEK